MPACIADTYLVLRVCGAALAAGMLLAACGGGGGGGGVAPGTSASPPAGQASPTPTPTPTAAPTPTPTPTPTPAYVTFSGTVTQLSGSLAHGSAVPASPVPAPVPGTPIAGAHVYVTTATGIFTGGTPNPVLAQATTAPDGTFTTPSLEVPAFNGSKAGIVVLDGSSVSSANGLTDKGFAVLHTQASVNAGNVAVPDLEIDTLSFDEASAAAEIEKLRANLGLTPVAIDEAALEAVRWSVQNNDGAGTQQCGIVMSPLDSLYAALGGQASPKAADNRASSNAAAAIDAMYQDPTAIDVWAAAAGPVTGPDCGSSPNPSGTTYYQLLTVSGATIF